MDGRNPDRFSLHGFQRYSYFKSLSEISHFQMIRTVESALLSSCIDRGKKPLLDLGCGDGTFAGSLELEQVYGIDSDNAAAAAMQNKGIYRQLILADASALPIQSATFASVFSNCAIEHMNHLSDVLKEIRRTLGRNGEFIFTAPTDMFAKFILEDPLLKELGCASREALDKYNHIHRHVNIFSLTKWRKVLKTAGFKLHRYEYYLPGIIGRFIAGMDVLYTLNSDKPQKHVGHQEKKFKSILGLPLRLYFWFYLLGFRTGLSGTHIMIKAVKV